MSDKKKLYASIYGALKPIRPDQYLVELIIQRRANKKGITLPNRFWADKNIQFEYWSKLFYSECKHAKPLFNKYDPECIIDAFQSFDCQYILSAANKQLDKVSREFQRRKDLLDSIKQDTEIVTVATNIVPNKPLGKKNKLSKLKDE